MKKIVAWVLGLALVLTGAAYAGSKKDEKKLSNKETYLKFHKEVCNKHNADAIPAFCAKNVKDHNPDPGQKGDLEGIQNSFKANFAAFPDLRISVKQVVEQGDYVAARCVITGTNTGKMGDMPATGKKVKVDMIEIVKFNKDGKAVERWGQYDGASMMKQLGLDKCPMPCCAEGKKGKKK